MSYKTLQTILYGGHSLESERRLLGQMLNNYNK